MITMNLCSPLNYSWGKMEPCVPLGVLSLAAVALSQGHRVNVKDISTICKDANQLSHTERLAHYLTEGDPDVIGFSTVCNSYPTTIRLAAECKRQRPNTFVVFGGPQASASAEETLLEFPAVDAIIVGEAETALVEFLHAMENKKSWKEVPNLVWRQNSLIVRNTTAPMLQDIDSLPLPAYDLNPFPITKSKSIPVEAGRGCPYRCTYCSTSRFWGHRFRRKSASILLGQISTLLTRYRMQSVELVLDNFTSSPDYCREFCKAIMESGLRFKWGCSARIDIVDSTLAHEMAEAGCQELFFGIESGSSKILRNINKRLDDSCVIENASGVVKAGITYTGSFIAGFPEENLSDIRKTLGFMFELRYVNDKRNFTHLHLLCPLPGTPILNQNLHRLEFDGLPSDISICILADKDKDMIRSHPKIFSAFYSIQNNNISRNLLRRIYLIMNLMMELPYTTFLLWKREGMRLVDLIIDHASFLESDDTNIFSNNRVEVIGLVYRFIKNFLLSKVTNPEGLEDLLRYEYAVNRVEDGQPLIETFAYDVEQSIARISQKPYDICLTDNATPSAFLFTLDDGKVKSTKLLSSLVRLIMEDEVASIKKCSCATNH